MDREAVAGIRVADFTWAASGPLATLYLALHGAEVIKIESARSLDIARRGYYTLVKDINASPNFNDMHLNKLAVRLNLADSRGAALARRLVTVSDVAVENFRPGVMERFGLGYQELRAVKPDLVMLSSSTSGQRGPERDLPGYATTFGAMGGLSYLTGHEGGPATEIWDSVDMRLGTAIALAVGMGVYHQRRHGGGQHVDLSSREVISTLIGDVFLEHQMTGRVPGRRGNRDERMAPHNCYPCLGADRWISIAVGSDEEWRALCRVAGRSDWEVDPRFADGYGRWRHQEELDARLTAWTRGQEATDLAQRLQETGVAATPSMDTQDLANDPHVRARGVFMDVPHPALGITHPVRPPWLLSETLAKARRHAPMFEEHQEYVFGELLGMGSREMAELQEQGVFE